MPHLRLRLPDGELRRPLAASTLLGRHLACTWALPVDQLPLYWLELRWVQGWAWRVLNAEDETRGPGRPLPGGWRTLPTGGQVSGPGDVSLLLEGADAPEPFLVNLASGAPLLGAELDEHVEERPDGWWPVLPAAGPLRDGQVFAHGGLYRFHAGVPARSTVRCTLSLLGRASLHLSQVGDTWRVELVEGDASVACAAECVRVLVPYVTARIEDVPRDGWLELDAAFDGWLEAGGRADSARERVAQDRSRLCRALAELGVAGTTALFETRKRGGAWVTRLVLDPDQLSGPGQG